METGRFWKAAAAVAILLLLALGLLALNLLVRPVAAVPQVAPRPSTGLAAPVLPGASTPEPGVGLQAAPWGGGDGSCGTPFTIGCGQQDSWNNFPPAQDYIDRYSCIESWEETGPEVIYALTLDPGAMYTVTAKISGMTADLDVFLLASGGCPAPGTITATCLTALSFNTDMVVVGDVQPGSYYVAVDGYRGVSDTYTLDVLCTVSNNLPNVPTSPDPTDGATGVGLTPTLTWIGGDPDLDPVTYDVAFSEQGSIIQELVCIGTTTPSCALTNPLQPNTTYEWSVTAYDNPGGQTPGPTWSFTTASDNNPPRKPSDPSPADGATGVVLKPRLSWIGGDPDLGETVVYTLYGHEGGTLVHVMAYTGTNTYYQVPTELKPNTTYHWYVDAKDQKGAVTQGDYWDFTTRRRAYLPAILKERDTTQPLPAAVPPTSTPIPTLTPPPTTLPPLPAKSGMRLVNTSPYIVVSLRIDGVEQYPAKPQGLPSGYYQDFDLQPGTYFVEAYNGLWNDDGTRFTMYYFYGNVTVQAGQMTVEDVSGPPITQLLPYFKESRYWWGEYWTGYPVTRHVASFCFYKDGTFRFFDDGVEKSIGEYAELYRVPGLVTFRATKAASTTFYDGVLNELDGTFTMKNGPADWTLIQYVPDDTYACPVAPVFP